MNVERQVAAVVENVMDDCRLPRTGSLEPSACLVDLGLQSLHFVELALRLEEAFPGAGAANFSFERNTTIRTLAGCLSDHGSDGGGRWS